MSTKVSRLIPGLIVLATSLASSPLQAADAAPAGLVPFVLPWDDGAPGPTDLSFLNHAPAGKFGPVHARPDGRFYGGDQRIRFLGVNLCFAATLPEKGDADKIAARMAKFGINVVRFHHMDMNAFPNGLIRRGSRKSGELDPAALDRLGFFLSKLKAHGIYADINLVVSRRFCSADGLPPEIDGLDWKLRHAIAMFQPAMIDLQKQYARDLLSYRNPHTGLALAADPAIAFVEINNENGLLQHWLGGGFDRLPAPFADELSRQWNAWLKARYTTNSKLLKAWAARREPLGRELLNNPSGPGQLGGWNVEQHQGAVAKAQIEQDVAGQSAALRIQVDKPGEQAWHVQFVHPGLHVAQGRLHVLTFTARADPPRKITVNLGQAHEPWSMLGFSQTVELTPQWTEHRFTITPDAAAANARICFTGMGLNTGSVWFSAVSLRTGGETGPNADETVEKGTLPLILHNDPRPWPAAAREDFVAFLRDTEGAYWRTMRQCVKEQLGFKGIVMGTITDCSPPTLQAEFDAVDGHAYWQHPSFPRRPWDPEDWTVRNVSMVNEPGGTLARLAMKRVAGKPYTVTEYNHPSPNNYGSEGPLLLAAYGALQDWDGLFLFAYAHGRDWNSRKIDDFFDISQHPTKMANMAAAALIFRAGQVDAARELITRDLTSQTELPLLAQHAHPWGMIDLATMGMNPATALLHRTAIRIIPSTSDGAPTKPSAAPAFYPPLAKGGLRGGLGEHGVSPAKDESASLDTRLLTSDTGQTAWDRREAGKGVVTIDSPRTKAVIGFTAGRSFDLGDVTITPGRTLQDWCTISLSLVEGESFAKPGRALLVATGSAENTGMHWKNAEHSSVGRQWGGPPSLVEVIHATIRLPIPPNRLKAWVLDEHGQRSTPLEIQPAPSGGSTIEIGGTPTLWYELAMDK
jgi:hypothetical protein